MLLQYLLLVLPSLLSFYFPLTSATPPLKPTSLNPLLTQKDFKSTTTQGVWFVEYFSPYCGHCRHFAPTWAKLVVHSKIPAGVQFAQVDCSVDGALCEANNVIGYPQLNLYRDGEFVDKFKGSRDLDLLIEYLAKSTVPPTGQPSKPVLKPVLKPSEEVVAIAHGFIEPTLTQEDFKATTAKGVWFVQYYTPWCGHCRRFSSTWTKLVLLSRKSTGSVQLAKVDCSASADLCKDVMGYPQMNLYRDGEFVETYDGSRRFDVLTEYFAEVDGTHTPAAMELTPETHHTAMAAPLLVLAAVGTAMKESIADRLSEIALEWRARSHGSDGDAVQFLWVSPEMEDRMTSFIVGDVDVRVMVVDHRMNRESYYLNEASGKRIQLTAESIFSVLEQSLGTTGEMPPSEDARVVVAETVESVVAQGMQYLYSADAYVQAHPLYTMYMLSLLLCVVYLGLRRCLRTELAYESDLGYDKAEKL